jgi:hypothetical protein
MGKEPQKTSPDSNKASPEYASRASSACQATQLIPSYLKSFVEEAFWA